MAKSNGQNYPAICLEQATSFVELIYEQQSNKAITPKIIAATLGLSVFDKALPRCVTSLLKYGLLKSVGQELFHVSEDAENIILLSRGHPDRITALKNAAFTPYIFSKLRELLGEELPENSYIYSSLTEMGFSSQPIEKIANSYVATLKFVQEEEEYITARTKACRQPAKKTGVIPPRSKPNSTDGDVPLAASHPKATTLQYQITLGCTARIDFTGQVTQAGIKKLIALLELNADVFPEKL